MDVFLSWSGKKSQKAAEIVRKWLPCIIQQVETFYSSEDIDKGSRGLSVIASSLARCQVGIIFITPDNINAPWINYEAGALSKSLDESKICTFLIDMDVKDILKTSPLAQFQATSPTKDDFLKLLVTINKQLEKPLKDIVLETAYDSIWPQIENELIALSKISADIIPKKEMAHEDSTTVSDNISEILELLRVDYKRMIKEMDFKIDGIKSIYTERENFSTKDYRFIKNENDSHVLLEFIASFKRDENRGLNEQADILADKISNALCTLGSTSIELSKRDNSPIELTKTLVFFVRIKLRYPITFNKVETLFRTANIDGFINIVEQ